MELGRRCGILMHISSLPSPFGIGDLGPGAREFAGFLAEAGQGVWQTLPLGPTRLEYGNSPYSGLSAFAGNSILISPRLLADRGLVSTRDLRRCARDACGLPAPGARGARVRGRPGTIPVPGGARSRVRYARVYRAKDRLLDRAFREALPGLQRDREYLRFCSEHRSWLEDYALFEALSREQGRPWHRWPPGLRDRGITPGRAQAEEPVRDQGEGPEPACGDELQRARERLGTEVERERFYQYLFHRQWAALRERCRRLGVLLAGDVPVYVNHDSSDVWSHRDLFNLDGEGRPLTVSGVPPDYYSETGQLWNNPIFRWDRLRETGYAWWVRRMQHNLLLFDWVRIDHFRGFAAFWEVPAGEPTAENGRWTPGPGEDFFAALEKSFPGLPFIAEDLGVITGDVTALRRRFGLPGMRVIQFGFGGDGDYHLPHAYGPGYVAYTGTHDNQTLVGWLRAGGDRRERRRALRYVGGSPLLKRRARWRFFRALMMSPAGWVVLPLQDVLGLGERARMNDPATAAGNWEWRLVPGALKPRHARRLAGLAELYGRSPRPG
ncbi:MAG: 4-alpha-glucanotransferase [Spirochaetota bacterium]